ncbi:MAG: YcaQ family DNA glycosylase [candidate division Zixibacteria bacterium]|nr:YcaQ family DNA glycosylase [candidate division Zixibacteria bacterium]
MKTENISIAQARRIALNAQMLDGRTKLPKGKEGIAQTIEKLGYIQIDTIAVIERAHHHTLWNRRRDYRPEYLDELQSIDRRIFEYWGHAASYLPIDDYRYYIKRMKGFTDPHGKWVKQRYEKCGHLMQPVLERIKNEGPLGSKDFKPPDNVKRGAWWNWRPAKVALELLFWSGELMITGRRKFQRRYDLTERVLPDDVDISEPTDEEQGRFLVARALNAYGVATEAEIRNHIFGYKKIVYEDAIAGMIASGEISSIAVGNKGRTKDFALTDSLDGLSRLRVKKPGISFLSPFDNLIIQRGRTKRLFDFDYTIECYVPKPKRKYGYFVLPILWGEHIVGRFDSKADRKEKTLLVHSLYLEDWFTPDDAFIVEFAKKLIEFAVFNKCPKIKIAKTHPAKWRKVISARLKKQ